MMPKRALLALVLLIVACRAQIRDLEGVRNPNAHAWPDEPVAVLIEHDPWAMVIGADTPRAEVFRDGTVLRLDVGDRSRPPQLLVSQLTATERDHLLNVIGPSWTFWRMRDEYNLAPNVTDMITTELIVSDGNRLKRIQVYGYAPEEWHPPAYTILPRNKTADSLPSEVDRICKVLATLKPHHEVPWEPRYIEVMMWPYDHSREQPLPGPREWPNLTSSMAFRRGDSYSLILPGSESASLEGLMATRGERQAISIDGRKWSLSYRPVMPGGRWARAIAQRLSKRSS